jgi:hypothetical protein
VKFEARTKLCIAVATGLASISWLPAALAQSGDDAIGQPEVKAQQVWRDSMHRINVPGEGCFHASYPSTKWEAIECAAAPGYRSALPQPVNRSLGREQTVGNAVDYVAQTPSGSLFSLVAGSFPTVTGVTSEKSVGVAAFGDGGILGTNEYTLQVNTNFFHSAACGSFKNCLAWQQYVLSTNTPVSLTSDGLTGDTEVFIEYWLIDYGSSRRSSCPSGFINGGADAEGPGVDCVQNTAATLIAKGQIPITDLSGLTLSGSATSGGTDAAKVTFAGEAFSITVKDSLTDIASGWSQAEFNVFGNAGGSEAEFNTGVSVTAKVALTDGSTTAPTCVSPSKDDGTTGETNNLTLGSCTATGGSSPSIQFTETH